ncbi:MAG: hypothetical protein KIT02_01155 [Devosia sp.]|uniref:hypothetical protein n=1 Tax=Devosia sp. TaxID=1871048 RepID=UPI0024C87FAD|nr:hypothetical protein [Devosia sp.]UYN99878.1 MAG: hypothetical protein KIT02_01155 [Devosia sp.]
MSANRIAAIALAATALALPALAQDKSPEKSKDAPAPAETMPLRDLDATRINPNQITIEFEYDGGACEEVGPAEVGELVDGTLAVTFPTISTAEVCTMQVVEIEVEQTIQAEHIISLIDVTLTRPDGSVLATGSTDVDAD